MYCDPAVEGNPENLTIDSGWLVEDTMESNRIPMQPLWIFVIPEEL